MAELWETPGNKFSSQACDEIICPDQICQVPLTGLRIKWASPNNFYYHFIHVGQIKQIPISATNRSQNHLVQNLDQDWQEARLNLPALATG